MSKIKSILMWVAVVAFIGFWVWETELKDIGYASLESKACIGITDAFRQNAMDHECVDADIDEKLSKDKDFYHGYALLDSGDTVEFWSWFRKDGTIKTAVKISNKELMLLQQKEAQ
ncbi:hypothetical protein nimi_44 [Escherichia phage nimi]|uniref:Uncharacterized protein n=1 Tax=Escherichia phage nimi TaxID=2696433 RepID=A0A6B9X8W2_9CAUD|nr:hypothetical protein nimi_44 [Escherichia phage nimi]HCO5859407.1 hypothetical protein [Escherichia coli]